MPREKIKFALRIHPETKLLVKDMCPKDNCSSQSEFIEKAVLFYAGYVANKDSMEYLPKVLSDMITGIARNSENHIARLLFKLTVELSMVMNILAAAADVDESKLPGLRERCIREIRGTSGAIKFDDAVRYQRGS